MCEMSKTHVVIPQILHSDRSEGFDESSVTAADSSSSIITNQWPVCNIVLFL